MATSLETVRAWLAPFCPGTLLVDHTGDVPGETSLCARGREELWRRRSVTGGCEVRQRETFAVYRAFASGGGRSGEGAAWAEGLCAFVAARQAAGDVPAIGLPGREGRIVRALKGARQSVPATGVALYMVTLTIEYSEKGETEWQM